MPSCLANSRSYVIAKSQTREKTFFIDHTLMIQNNPRLYGQNSVAHGINQQVMEIVGLVLVVVAMVQNSQVHRKGTLRFQTALQLYSHRIHTLMVGRLSYIVKLSLSNRNDRLTE